MTQSQMAVGRRVANPREWSERLDGEFARTVSTKKKSHLPKGCAGLITLQQAAETTIAYVINI